MAGLFSFANSALRACVRALAAILPPSLFAFLSFLGLGDSASRSPFGVSKSHRSGDAGTVSRVIVRAKVELARLMVGLSLAVLPRRRGFMAGTGGATGEVTLCGSCTKGTDDVLDTKVGSEIMVLVTDLFRLNGPVGVPRPLALDPALEFERGPGDGRPRSIDAS